MIQNKGEDKMEVNTQTIIATEKFDPHWKENLSEVDYHSNKGFVGSTSLRKILSSPKAFYWDFFKGNTEESTDDMKIGTLLHSAVLEGTKFLDKYVLMPDFGDFRSPKNREKRDAWKNDLPAGTMVVKQDELEMIKGVVGSVLEHEYASSLLKNGKPEISGFYADEETGIKLKVRPDFLSFDGTKLIDFKSTRSADWRKYGGSVYDYRYDFQMFMYSEGIKFISGKKPEMHVHIAVEKKPPYECAVYYFLDEDLGQAHSDYRMSLDKLKHCITENKWQQRQVEAERVYVPNWFILNSTEGLT